jgi:trehalose-phosphatase
MQVLDERFDWPTWRGSLDRAATRVLFLDYDGTLVPFTARRDGTTLSHEIRRTLEDLVRTPRHRLVFVSGRSAESLQRLLDLDPTPEIFGSYGMETIDAAGRVRAEPLSDAARRILDRVARDARVAFGADRIEVKPLGVAMHVRGLTPEAASGFVDAFRRLAVWRGRPTGFRLFDFDGGVEFHARGRGKGDVVTSVLADLTGPVAAAYLGDDLTDEDGFRALDGHGASILVRSSPRPTAANLWLRPPSEVRNFLSMWRDVAREAAQ